MHLHTDLGHVLLVVGPRLGRQLLAENPVAARVLVLALHRRADALEVKLRDGGGGGGKDMRFLSGNLLQVPISIKLFFFNATFAMNVYFFFWGNTCKRQEK